jgi:hypothetical protein
MSEFQVIARLYGGPYDGQHRMLRQPPEKLHLPDEKGGMRFTLPEGTTMLRHVYRRAGRVLNGIVEYDYEGMST